MSEYPNNGTRTYHRSKNYYVLRTGQLWVTYRRGGLSKTGNLGLALGFRNRKDAIEFARTHRWNKNERYWIAPITSFTRGQNAWPASTGESEEINFEH